MARKAQRAGVRMSHAMIRRWSACDMAALGCNTAGGLAHDTTRPAHDTARRARASAHLGTPVRTWVRQCAPGHASAHLGAPVHTWACLLGQLGARASGLVFRTGFRLGDISESPFGPGS